tara:strand:- start:2 stop:130 length:129 start_codon:yes stop_codon:yes gene_type:complete
MNGGFVITAMLLICVPSFRKIRDKNFVCEAIVEYIKPEQQPG